MSGVYLILQLFRWLYLIAIQLSTLMQIDMLLCQLSRLSNWVKEICGHAHLLMHMQADRTVTVLPLTLLHVVDFLWSIVQ